MEMIYKRLSQLSIEKIEVFDTNIKVFAKSRLSKTTCNYCYSSSIKLHGLSETRITDLPYDNKKVNVYVKRTRYKCFNCHKTFFETTPHKFHHHNMTVFVADFILSEYNRIPCNKLANLLHIDRKTITYFIEKFKIKSGDGNGFNYTKKTTGSKKVKITNY